MLFARFSTLADSFIHSCFVQQDCDRSIGKCAEGLCFEIVVLKSNFQVGISSEFMCGEIM